MFLLADSGSTKTTWALAGASSVVQSWTTGGMNPYFQSEAEMRALVGQEVYRPAGSNRVEKIFFYGAGCNVPEKNRLVEQALRSWWPEASVFVGSDLLGAAYALCGGNPGIACILGTGSNSCLFDGRRIEDQISPLGYVLGDEGSGAVLGKLLVGDYLKRRLPEPLRRAFQEEYGLSLGTILDRVYHQPFPNRFLASLSPFLYKHLEEPACHELVYRSFCSFIERNVMAYQGYDCLPVHFVGSVAYYYQKVLREAAETLGIHIGRIEKDPMPGLIHYLCHSFRK